MYHYKREPIRNADIRERLVPQLRSWIKDNRLDDIVRAYGVKDFAFILVSRPALKVNDEFSAAFKGGESDVDIVLLYKQPVRVIVKKVPSNGSIFAVGSENHFGSYLVSKIGGQIECSMHSSCCVSMRGYEDESKIIAEHGRILDQFELRVGEIHLDPLIERLPNKWHERTAYRQRHLLGKGGIMLIASSDDVVDRFNSKLTELVPDEEAYASFANGLIAELFDEKERVERGELKRPTSSEFFRC